MLTFTHEIKESAFKPGFIFLGSILTQQDIHYKTSHRKVFQPQKFLEEWKYEEGPVSPSPLFTPFIQKSLYLTEQVDSGKKRDLKNIFFVEKELPEVIQKKAEGFKDVEAGSEMPSYRPLRFHTR